MQCISSKIKVNQGIWGYPSHKLREPFYNILSIAQFCLSCGDKVPHPRIFGQFGMFFGEDFFSDFQTFAVIKLG